MTFTLRLVLFHLREPLVLSPYIYCYITFTFALQCEPRVLAPPSHAARREKMTGDDAFMVAPPAPRDDERRRRPTTTIFSLSLRLVSRVEAGPRPTTNKSRQDRDAANDRRGARRREPPPRGGSEPTRPNFSRRRRRKRTQRQTPLSRRRRRGTRANWRGWPGSVDVE